MAVLSPSTSQIVAISRRYASRTRHYPPRIDGRSKEAKRIKALTATYKARLGAAADDPVVRADILDLAECTTICEALRAAALRGEPIDLLALNRLEGTTRRRRAALGLDGPPPEPPVPLLSDLLAEADSE